MLHLFHGKFLLSHSLFQGFVVMLFVHAPPQPVQRHFWSMDNFFVAAICGMLLRKHSSHVFSGGSIFSSVFYGGIPWVVCSALSSVLFGSLYEFSRFSQGHPFYALYDSQWLWCCCEYISCSSTHYLTTPLLDMSCHVVVWLWNYKSFFCCCTVVCVVWQWNVFGYWRYALSLVCWLYSASASSSFS